LAYSGLIESHSSFVTFVVFIFQLIETFKLQTECQLYEIKLIEMKKETLFIPDGNYIILFSLFPLYFELAFESYSQISLHSANLRNNEKETSFLFFPSMWLGN